MSIHLGRAQLPAQTHRFLTLVGVHSTSPAAVDVNPPQPPTEHDAEVPKRRPFGDGMVTSPEQLDRSPAEIVWILHWHEDILQALPFGASIRFPPTRKMPRKPVRRQRRIESHLTMRGHGGRPVFINATAGCQGFKLGPECVGMSLRVALNEFVQAEPRQTGPMRPA